MSNAARAKALMEDMEAWNPEEAERTNLEELERFLDGMDKKERQYMEVLKERIPKDLPPDQYAKELSWKYQQVREIINDEISHRYR